MNEQRRKKLHRRLWQRHRISIILCALCLSFAGVVYAEPQYFGSEQFIRLETTASTDPNAIEAKILPHVSQADCLLLMAILFIALLFFIGLSYRLWKRQGLAERRAMAEMHSTRKKTFALGESYTRQMNNVFYKSVFDGVDGPLSEILKTAMHLQQSGRPDEGKEIFAQAGNIAQFLVNVRRLNRLSSGKLTVKMQTVSCHDFLQAHMQRLQKVAALRGIRFRTQYPNMDCHRQIIIDQKLFSPIFIRLATLMLQNTPDGGRFSVSTMVPQMHDDRSALWISLNAPDIKLSEQLFQMGELLFNDRQNEAREKWRKFDQMRKHLPLSERAILAEFLVLNRQLEYIGGRWSFHRDHKLGVIVDLEFFVDLV